MADGDDPKAGEEGEEEGLPDFIDTDADDEVAAAPESEAAAATDEPADEPEAAAATDEPAEEPEADPVEQPAAAAEPPPAAPPAPPSAPVATVGDEEEEPYIVMKPHADGLFETRPVDPADIDESAIEEAFGTHAVNKPALGLAAGVALFTILSLAYIVQDDALGRDLQCFLDGTVEKCKTAAVADTKRKWRDEDFKAQNKYGDVTLMYFPADAHVKVTQVRKHTKGDDWRLREGLPKCPADDATMAGAKSEEPAEGKIAVPAVSGAAFADGKDELANETANLKEGQTIERLPLLNLPIFETKKDDLGCVGDVLAYTYELEISRKGYHTAKKTFRPSQWKRIGPQNLVIEWPGLDLVPKPETIKRNFKKVMCEEQCLRTRKKLATMTDSMADENFEIMLLRNGFKTKEDFLKVFENLTKTQLHGDWWKATQEAIKKVNCDEPRACSALVEPAPGK